MILVFFFLDHLSYIKDYLIEFFLQVSIHVSYVQFESVRLVEVNRKGSGLLKTPSYCVIKFLKCNFRILGQACVDVVCFRGTLFHEKQRYVGDRAVVNKVFKRVGPKKNGHSSQNLIRFKITFEDD